ncbi:methyltransferase domain-containing protein [Colletotrichum incanum]|nr:methyltransferase domain-containing protein [Colletotrichum incanum]
MGAMIPISTILTAADKAKLRRQQVRKAQIQHRTRKANYIKQLELDVCRFRDMIAAAEKEVLAFRRQNEGMRGALTARGLSVPVELKGKEVVVDEVRVTGSQMPVEEVTQPVAMQQQQQQGQQRQQGHPQALEQHQPPQQMFVPPVFQQQLPAAHPEPQVTCQPQLADDNYEYDPYPPVDLFADIDMGEVTVTMRKDDALGTPCFQIVSSSPAVVHSPAPDQLTPEQEIIAINLILAMEHICWNHFHPRQFPAHADPCSAASGHTMMASTMCMSSAPARVYRTIRRGEAETTTHTWRADTGAGSALSLKSLLSLAKTLNPGDIELTPVQAWFELAARYGAAALMRENVIEALKKEFCGVVDCIHFGAIIERDAFESVVARVMEQVGIRELEWEMDVDDERVNVGMVAGSQGIVA